MRDARSSPRPLSGAVILAICLVPLAGVLWSRPVDAQATFAAGVNTIATYVTVVRDDGTLVSGLSANDFEIVDEGKPRNIALFEAGLLPITIVVLLDDSPSMQTSRSITEAAATAFVKRLLPKDRATVGVFSRTVRIDGALTSDHDQLLERVHTSSPVMAGTALWDAINAGMSALEEESGRRVVLILTDGDDNTSEASTSAVVTRAVREGVMLYAIGVRGSEGRVSPSLRDLARDTGGSYLELKGTKDLASAFQRVADELHNQYLLGFSVTALDGKSHQLTVKVKRRGLKARARRSYLASPAN